MWMVAEVQNHCLYVIIMMIIKNYYYYYYYYYYYCYSPNRNKTDITHFSYAMSVVYCIYQRNEIVPHYFWKRRREECEKVIISKVQKWDLMLSIFSYGPHIEKHSNAILNVYLSNYMYIVRSFTFTCMI